METEGRSYSEFFRNTSEEIFLKTLMDGSMGMPVPTMEMLGFKNLTQSCRTDSEELFKNWLTNAEVTGIGRHPRQLSRRISRELAGLTGHHHLASSPQRKQSNENLFPQHTPMVEEPSSDPNDNQNSTRNMTDVGVQASNIYLAKAWFQSSQPMTRSRSSELRRRYVAMQISQTPLGMQNMSSMSDLHHVDNMKPDITNQNGFNDISMCEIPNQFNSFMSPSNSSSSTFNAPPPIDNVDKVSSVVSMLKDTLERKKISNQGRVGLYSSQEDTSLNQGQGSHFHETLGAFQDVSSVQATDPSFMQTIQGSYNVDLEHFVTPVNLRPLSREPSQSESSAAATIAFDTCDGPSNSGQTMSETSWRQAGTGRSLENGSKDMKDRFNANLKEGMKKGSLIRHGSVTSAGSGEKGDPTKKRRVERSRKMAEAKERNMAPSIPSDMQSILKRCENLEKEVRSLKLNLAFMNRKDSEQTKQIEELQGQNEELTEEKKRLLEEIERIVGEEGM